MKLLSTISIAVILFTLCIMEKESKQRDLEALNKKNKTATDQDFDNVTLSAPAYSQLQNNKNEFIAEKFRLSEVTLSDSVSKSFEPTPFLGKLPLLNRLFSENNVN